MSEFKFAITAEYLSQQRDRMRNTIPILVVPPPADSADAINLTIRSLVYVETLRSLPTGSTVVVRRLSAYVLMHDGNVVCVPLSWQS